MDTLQDSLGGTREDFVSDSLRQHIIWWIVNRKSFLHSEEGMVYVCGRVRAEVGPAQEQEKLLFPKH